jgi:hypothetical protein
MRHAAAFIDADVERARLLHQYALHRASAGRLADPQARAAFVEAQCLLVRSARLATEDARRRNMSRWAIDGRAGRSMSVRRGVPLPPRGRRYRSPQ